jgi:hypothetical protein
METFIEVMRTMTKILAIIIFVPILVVSVLFIGAELMLGVVAGWWDVGFIMRAFKTAKTIPTFKVKSEQEEV